MMQHKAAVNSDKKPVALVAGQPVQILPADLYVPPDALQVFLEAFEGPLDLLLYLVKRQNIDVLKLPVTLVTEQYMQYVNLMHRLRLDIASDYMVMAALLAEIKSRMLLPRQQQEEDEDDPRAELALRLLEYQQFKQAAAAINDLQRMERDIFAVRAYTSNLHAEKKYPQVGLQTLLVAFQDVVHRTEHRNSYCIQREPMPVHDRMTIILLQVSGNELVPFSRCFMSEEGRGGIIASFIAVLEMLRSGVIETLQTEAYGQIYLRAASVRM